MVRFGPERDGFLDQRVTKFDVNGASPRGALEALLAILDPSRASGFGVQGAGRPPAGREGEAGARSGAPITLSLTDVTVLDALNAIATANGAMSWMVNYDPGRALYESATIQFIEGGYRVTALSKLSLAQPIPLAKPEAHGVVTLPRVIVSVPMNAASLLTTVERLSASLAVPVGAEVTTGFPLLSPRDLVTPAVGHGASGPATGLAGGVVGDVPRGVPAASSGQLARAYDLTGLTMPEALTKLAEWNLEYAWTEDNGVYHIRPRAVHAASQALDARVDRFANRYNDVPSAALAIRDLIDRLTAPRPPSPTVITSWVSSGSRTPDMQKPLTLDLSNLTVRQLLDAMVTEHGRLSWTFETRSQANGVSTWQLRIHSFDGSTSSPPPIVR